ncbi:MAG: amidase [Candidimonas sp.]|nr:MAG: amidase [Candidimonas sp.]
MASSERVAADPACWPVWRLSEAIGAGRLSPVELVDAHLARIGQFDGKLHAYTEVYGTDARRAAHAAALAIRAGHAVGPLHGIPIAIKDLVQIEGRVVTGGCAVWRTRRSTVTATLVRRLLAQGMILLGKTHMTEFAMEGWGTNAHMGTPWNPWDDTLARTPGGSSSGSAVAVAAGLAPWAVGTDTGGSVRVPAAWCGLTSLKTSAGRISNFGLLPTSRTLDTPGPMARDARDVALLYDALAGSDPRDPRTLGLPGRGAAPQEGHRGVAGLRLARMPDSERAAISAPVLAAYDRCLDEFADSGAEIVSLALPGSFAEIASLSGRIMAAEAYSVLHDLVDDASQPLDENVRPKIAAGRNVSAGDYLSVLARRAELVRAFDATFAGVDALLMPTSAWTALPLEAIDRSVSPMALTRFANFLDLCVVAMPNGFDAQGLPTSVQVICRRFNESMALRIAGAYQAATVWHERHPANYW